MSNHRTAEQLASLHDQLDQAEAAAKEAQAILESALLNGDNTQPARRMLTEATARLAKIQDAIAAVHQRLADEEAQRRQKAVAALVSAAQAEIRQTLDRYPLESIAL